MYFALTPPHDRNGLVYIMFGHEKNLPPDILLMPSAMETTIWYDLPLDMLLTPSTMESTIWDDMRKRQRTRRKVPKIIEQSQEKQKKYYDEEI